MEIGKLLFTCLWCVFSLWDGQTRFTVIKLDSPIVIESFDPQTKEGIKLILPNDLQVQTWPVKSLSKAGSETWAADEIASTLGIVYTSLDTKLNIVDRFVWWKNGRNKNWIEIDLEKTVLVSEITDPDGQELYKLSPFWAEKANLWFVSTIIANEKISVEIINTTGINGAGTQSSRKIESAGMKVGLIKNGERTSTQCSVLSAQSTKTTYSVKLLLKEFGCTWSEKPSLGDHDVILEL